MSAPLGMSSPEGMNGEVPDFIRHPRLREVYSYWRGLSLDGALPLRSAIDATAIPHCLPYINLLDAGATPDDLRYRLAGSAITTAFGFEPRGLTRREIRARHVQPQMHPDFDLTSRQTHDVAARRLVSYTHDRMTSYERRFMAYVRLMLPISEDGARASGILGIIIAKRDEDPFWHGFQELHVEKPLAELGFDSQANATTSSR